MLQDFSVTENDPGGEGEEEEEEEEEGRVREEAGKRSGRMMDGAVLRNRLPQAAEQISLIHSKAAWEERTEWMIHLRDWAWVRIDGMQINIDPAHPL